MTICRNWQYSSWNRLHIAIPLVAGRNHDERDPLEDRLRELRDKYVGNAAALAELNEEQREIDMYKKYQQWYGSVFFVMQRNDT